MWLQICNTITAQQMKRALMERMTNITISVARGRPGAARVCIPHARSEGQVIWREREKEMAGAEILLSVSFV